MKQNYLRLFLIFSGIILTATSVAQVYSSVPYSTGFETGALDASWTETNSQTTGEVAIFTTGVLVWSGQTAYSHTGTYFMGMHNANPGGAYNLNTANLHLDMAGESDYRLNFWWAEWNEETEPEDGLYISDDGGATFTKVLNLNGASYTDLQYYQFNMSLDSINTVHGLSFGANYIIRWQQYDNYYFAGGNDGFLVDDISVYTNSSGCVPTSSSISISACDDYTVPSGSNTYSTGGTYVDVIDNIAGCDSTITIDLVINNSTTSLTNITECISYTWTDGNTYTTSGTYNQILTNMVGCDSNATLDLIINDAPNMTVASSDGVTLEASGTAVSYQWIDCATLATVGTSTATYVALTNGDYAVIGVSADGCADTSACFNVNSAGLYDYETNSIVVYPNPVADVLNIIAPSLVISVAIYSTSGELIYTTSGAKVGVDQLAGGTYFVTITTESGEQNTTRFVKL